MMIVMGKNRVLPVGLGCVAKSHVQDLALSECLKEDKRHLLVDFPSTYGPKTPCFVSTLLFECSGGGGFKVKLMQFPGLEFEVSKTHADSDMLCL